MKKLFLFALLLGLASVIGHAQTTVQATPVPLADAADDAASGPGTRAPGDFLYDLNVEALSGDPLCLGLECDNTYWYMTGARNSQGAYFYQMDYACTTLVNMVATGHTSWGWRDLAYDGTYLYTSDSNIIEQVDPATGLPTGLTIPGPVSPCRAMAYDGRSDTFWTASFSSQIFQIDRQGTVLQRIANPGISIYGAAMEEKNHVLWWWSQDGSGTECTAMDPLTGKLTGDKWDGGGVPAPGIAGGCCVHKDPTHGTVFAGIHQTTGSYDNISVYKILPDPNPVLDIKVNGLDNLVLVQSGQNAKITIDLEARGGAGTPADVWVVLKTPFGFYSYNGTGPISGWNAGTNHAAFTGPLKDLNATVLDRTLPAGTYKAILGLDSVADGSLTLSALVGKDNCEFWCF